MSALGEERFRELLDARGLLRPGALAPPERSAVFTVFAQRSDAALDIAALKTHASRFFDTKLGLTVAKSYVDAPPASDAARIVLASDDGAASGTRLCFGRPTDAADRAAAEAAERAQSTHGMALLAHRCPMVWLVVRESDDDRVALTLAAILASALLGPILAPAGDELFGVRTARMKLEGRPRPYR
ncbi:MAG: hypothetical protein KF795_17785 [Labilithrix sp.]|nr:hypothetical protein [Labilithrix sp.]